MRAGQARTLLITREQTGTTLTVGDMALVVVTGATTALGTRYYTYAGAEGLWIDTFWGAR